MGRLLAELFTQTRKSRHSFRPDLFSEREEDLQKRRPVETEKLERHRVDAVHVAGLLDGEDGLQLIRTDVQVQRRRLHVEEVAPGAEAAETANHLTGYAGIGH